MANTDGQAHHIPESSSGKTTLQKAKAIGEWLFSLFAGLFVAAGVLLVGVALISSCYKSIWPTLDVRLSGRIDPGIINDDQFIVYLSHYHTGTLKNGRIDVTVRGNQVKAPAGEDSKTLTHSFETWVPNDAGKLEFPVKLKTTQDLDLWVTVMVRAEGISNYFEFSHWKGSTWESAQARE